MVQLKRHDRIDTIPVERDTSKEAMNVTEPPSEDTPSTCNARIAKLIEELLEYVASESGQ